MVLESGDLDLKSCFFKSVDRTNSFWSMGLLFGTKDYDSRGYWMITAIGKGEWRMGEFSYLALVLTVLLCFFPMLFFTTPST